MSFRDPRLAPAERVADLLSRLTLDEKIALLHQHQPAVPRLGLESFRTGTEALHGLAWLGPATVFPQAVGLASSWNPDLLTEVGSAVGDEARGFHHKDPERGGLNVWAPVVNALRDPRWGRNEEGYAEDPLLTARLATAYARGLRGDHPRYLKTAPTLKHFLAYNNETRRDTSSSSMPPRVLREYELPAFRAPIEAGVAVAVMASYNLVNGRPAHLSPLINDELRGWSADDLLLVSDAQAPSNVVTVQHYHPDHASSHAAMVKAGVDSFTENDDRASITIERIREALDRGLLTESDVDTAVGRTLTIRLRLGEFDESTDNPYAGITAEVINCAAHQALAARAAREAMVLLKNDGSLPLGPDTASVAVLGPLADTLYEDWYSGTLPYARTARAALVERLGADQVRFADGADRVALRTSSGRYLTMDASPHGGLVRAAADCATPDTWIDLDEWGQGVVALRSPGNGRYLTVDQAGALVNEALRPGGWVVQETFEFVARAAELVIRHKASGRYLRVDADGVPRAMAEQPSQATGFRMELLRDGVAEAVAAARSAQVAVVVLGNHPMINGRETEDRVDLELPPTQERLVRAVYAANPRTVLVVTSSYPYAIDWAQEHVPAILWSAHGGQEFGGALTEVLFGDVAPAGRLTQTWYSGAAQLPDLFDYDIIANDATYLYQRSAPLYPFGHGLTYSPVRYANLRLSATEVAADGEVTVSVDVTNTGDRATDEVVQLYTRQRRSRVKQPLRQLRDFQRVPLTAGETRTLHFGLRAAKLAFWDVTRDRFVVEESGHTVMLGASSLDIRCSATLAVHGEVIPPRAPGLWPAVNFDEYAGAVLTDAGPVTGDAVSAVEPGAWLCFGDSDLDGVTACTVTVSRTGVGPAALQLRLDDPLDGELIGAVRVGCEGGRYRWESGTTPISSTGGVRDLFVVFGGPGINVSTVELRR